MCVFFINPLTGITKPNKKPIPAGVWKDFERCIVLSLAMSLEG